MCCTSHSHFSFNYQFSDVRTTDFLLRRNRLRGFIRHLVWPPNTIAFFIRTSYLPNMAVETAYFVSGRRQLSSQVTPSHAMRRKWKYDTSTRSSAVRLENLELESTHVTLLATLYCFQHSLMPVILRAHFHPTCNRHERQGGVLLLAPSCALRVHHLLNHRN